MWKLLKNESGFSLVEALVAAGILGTMAVSLMQVSGNLGKEKKGTAQRSQTGRVTSYIHNLLLREDVCEQTIAAIGVGDDFDQIRGDSGVLLDCTAGDDCRFGYKTAAATYDADDQVTITRMSIIKAGTFGGAASSIDGANEVTIEIEFTKPRADTSYGGATVLERFSLPVVMSGATAIDRCLTEEMITKEAMCEALGGRYTDPVCDQLFLTALDSTILREEGIDGGGNIVAENNQVSVHGSLKVLDGAANGTQILNGNMNIGASYYAFGGGGNVSTKDIMRVYSDSETAKLWIGSSAVSETPTLNYDNSVGTTGNMNIGSNPSSGDELHVDGDFHGPILIHYLDSSSTASHADNLAATKHWVTNRFSWLLAFDGTAQGSIFGDVLDNVIATSGNTRDTSESLKRYMCSKTRIGHPTSSYTVGFYDSATQDCVFDIDHNVTGWDNCDVNYESGHFASNCNSVYGNTVNLSGTGRSSWNLPWTK